MPARMMLWAQRIAIALFVGSLLIGMLVPVYTDEVAWRYLERAALDGIDKPLNDGCGPNSFASPVFFMWPVRAFSAAMGTQFADPFYVRLSGIFYALLITALTVLLIRRLAAGERQARLVTTIVFSLLGLGMMPWVLVWSRPEQPLVAALLGAALIAFGSGGAPRETTSATTWRRAIAILLLGLVALSYHLKGVVLAPAFAVCLLWCGRGRGTFRPRLIVGGVLVIATALAAHYWVDRSRCPGDPILAAHYAQANIAAALSRGDDWRSMVAGVLRNANPMSYVWLISPSTNPMSRWLPIHLIGRDEAQLWLSILVLCWKPVLYFSLALLAFVAFGQLRARRLDLRLVLPITLFGVAIVWAASQLRPNIYESLFGLPLLALVIVLALSSPMVRSGWLRWGEWLAMPLLLVAIASPVRMTMLYGPAMIAAAGQRGYIADQPFSQPVFGYDDIQPRILATARQCGIPLDRRLHGLLIDDTTYFAFVRSYRPEHWLGTLSVWNGSISDPVAHLRGIGSDGMVVGCHMLAADLRGRAHSNGPFCCLGPRDWAAK